jgi:drug/metabolite transporter (DMT)-like permease
MTDRLKALLALVLATFFWGLTFPLQKFALSSGISPLVYNILRFGIAALVSLIIWRSADFKYGTILGIVLGLAYAAQTWGLSLTTSSRSGFITALFVVFVPIFSYLIEGRRPRGYHILSLALATVGLYLLTRGEIGFGLGELLTLICAILFGLHVVLITVFSQRVPEESLLFWQFLIVAVINGVMAFYMGHSWRISSVAIGVAVFTALTASVYGIWAQLKYQKVISSNTSALIFTLEPVFAYLTSILILGDKLVGLQWVGAGLLLFSTVLVSVVETSK